MLKMIPRHPSPISVTDIEAKLASDGFVVTRRTIERDLEKLSQHFDIEADKRDKPYGRYWSPIIKGLDIAAMSMSQAVTFTLVESHLKPLLPVSMLEQLTPYFIRALKILSNLNELASAKWLDKVRVIPATQSLLPSHIDPKVQEAVYGAVFGDCQIKVTYLKKGVADPQDFIVNPIGLVQRGQIMYLVCTYPKSESQKPVSLALHRMQAAVNLDRATNLPKGVNLDTAIEAGLLAFPRSDLTEFAALFDRKAASHLFESPLSHDQIIADIDANHVLVTATIADTELLKWWLLGFGVKVEVIKPTTLRHRITDIVKGLHRTYCENDRESREG